ncbi:extracellular solute-binding protein [[Clostridium] symbiosum]|uniref:extracellular solute-binding protein n=1 Tax=Clostridium symbiosum TaxID=1512 RepID=UPI001D0706FA|nr:extracellular solute-binding protein [[Clostridium] symbiosum]MCB6608978.1 extracellular solute-binding protein [[Clostridium] symbiosum]MCB6929118.1 extracellular solute-binding protein [[Clostridium] symbiosum]
MRYRRWIRWGLSLVALSFVTGCSTQVDSRQQPEESQTKITMMYPKNLKNFEELVDTEYPDIDLQVEMTTTAVMNSDSERRLRKGHGTDLVVTTFPTGEVKNYTLDLSAETFATAYQGSITGPVMVDGQTRYLPLPGQYSGYILNRTLVEELGMEVPDTNRELTELFKAAKEQGKGIGEDGAMFGLVTVSPGAVGTYIIGTQVPDFLGTAAGIRWMSDFEAGTAGFNGIWDDSLALMFEWTKQGYLNSDTLSANTRNAMPVEERMLNGTLVMSYGNVQMLSKLNSKSSQYEYTMLPYLSDKGNEPWITSEPDGYIGINGALANGNEKKKLDACIRILRLLSTPEGQEAWMVDTSSIYSYLQDYKPVQAALPEEIAGCVENGYIYDLQLPSNIVQYFGKCMISALDEKMDLKEALAAIDDYCINGSPEVDYGQSVVGSVADDLLYENYNTRKEETAIGNLIADALKEYTGADIAVVNGGGIRGSLYEGDVLGEDLNAVCPYPNEIITVEAKGAVIADMLRNGISQTEGKDMIPSGRFLQVSGLSYSYRPAAEGKTAELLSVFLEDGSEVGMDTWYTLAITNYMAGSSGYLNNNGDGYTMLNLYSDTAPKTGDVKLLKETGATYGEALRQYFQNHRDEPVQVKLEGRITVAGDSDE